MEKFNTDGVVIKTGVTGEADLIVFVLTRNRGIVRAFAKGARSTKNKLHAGSSLFAYCDFSFTEKNGVYHITEASVKEVFFELRADMSKISLAQYFCEVLLKTLPDGDADEDYLRLFLGALYYLCRSKKHVLLIKSVFELRYASLSGYAPPIHACAQCGTFRTDVMYFNCFTGDLYCNRCAPRSELPELPFSVIAAMRHILFSSFETIFAFQLTEDCLHILSRITETYLQNCMQQRFKLLDFLRTVL